MTNHKYTYPRGLKLTPDSSLHGNILSKVLRYGQESARVMNERHKSWRKLDDKLTAFIHTSDAEKLVLQRDSRKPVSIVFPYTYAILETLVAYLIGVFGPEPTFRYEGNGPEDTPGAIVMEKLINLHCNRNKIVLNLHTMFRDACVYGFGVVSPQWITRIGTRDIRTPEGERQTIENMVLFEGNNLINIDPYRYLPDISFPLTEVQRGGYVGWTDTANYFDLLTDEEFSRAQGSTETFNVKYIREMNSPHSAIFGGRQSIRGQRNRRLPTETQDATVSNPVDILHMYVKLIPKEWELGSGTAPEKWLFTVAGDSVIIQARPLGLHHNLFPVCVCAPDFDGYSPLAYSRMEMLAGIQTIVDWLFNSHIANVRKAVNNVLVVDPEIVNINDLKNPGEGGIVRLRRNAFGKGVKDGIMQLGISDITRQHVNDVGTLTTFMQMIAGTDNAVMGALRKGGPERLTGAEFEGTSRGMVSRLERIAKVIGVQAMQDIGYFFAYHAQQLMTADVYVRTVGTWPDSVMNQFSVRNGRVLVHPEDILVDYDLIVRDGSIPGGSFSEAHVQLFQAISQNEALMQRFDLVKIFKFIMQATGAKNVEDFEIQVQPDMMVDQQVQQGNMMPVGDMLG